MSEARRAILENIKRRREAGVRGRVPYPDLGGVADTGVLWAPEGLPQFIEKAQEEQTTIGRIESLTELPAAVGRYLESERLRPDIVVPPDESFKALPWRDEAGLRAAERELARDGETVVTRCLAGVAEAGAVAVASGPNQRTEHCFLAETHIVLMRRAQVLPDMESLWMLLSRQPVQPRAVNLIMGPSRTADLGVPAILGAHGPARVHIIICD